MKKIKINLGFRTAIGYRHKNGGGFVEETAKVEASAYIGKMAKILNNAQVSDYAWVSGNAQISGNAWVSGNAQVSGKAWVSGNAQISSNAQVYGNAQISGDAWVSGNAQVSGDKITSLVKTITIINFSISITSNYIFAGCNLKWKIKEIDKVEYEEVKNYITKQEFLTIKKIIKLMIKL